jgi:sugar lactone lactonase YvrE
VLSPQGKYIGLIPTPRNVISSAFSGRGKKTLYVVGLDGQDLRTPPGVRNNAKPISTIPMLAQGFQGRAK